jgi:hypothetical protein
MQLARIAWYGLVTVVVIWIVMVLMLVLIGMVEALACGIPIILIGVTLSLLFWYYLRPGKDKAS